MKTSRINTRHGFTLIELLVVIAIMGVVTTLGTKAFIGMFTHWRATTTMTELENKADDVFEEIARDISEALSADISGISIVGINDEWVESKNFKPESRQSDRIIIPIQEERGTGGVQNAVSIQYALVHDKTFEGNIKSSLIRSAGSLGTQNFDNSNSGTDVIADTDTLVFDVEYASGTEWVSEWNEPTLPKAIRVGIVVAKRDEPRFQISRKAVFAVAVQ